MPAKIHLPPELAADRQRDGARIRRLRRDRGWTQENLAERSGLDRNTISRMETGARGLPITAYYLVAHSLGVPLWRLFRDE
jgi:transcriptional regulator with XRE-family HTH domain